LGSAGLPPDCGGGMAAYPLKLRPSVTCYPAEFGGALLKRSAWKKIWPLAFRLSKALKIIGTDIDRFAAYDLTFHSKHGPISYGFRDKWRFQSNIANFSQRSRWRSSPWNWVWALMIKKRRMTGLPGRERRLTIRLTDWLQYTNVSTWRTDRQTDGRTDGYRPTAETALTHSVAR